MKQFIENEKRRKQRNKKLENWACILFVVGLFLTAGGMSTEEMRDKMPPVKANSELRSPKVTFSMMGAGLVSMIGATVLLAKRKDESR